MERTWKQPQIITRKTFERLRNFLKKGKYDGYVILCDEGTLAACMPVLVQEVPDVASSEIIEIESGETSKTVEICAGIWQSLADMKASRKTLLVNLGGGVVCDTGGFCAALYKRGMPFIHVPTSLLAMADAAIGGKTGVDLGHLKNAVGTFANPEAIFIGNEFLATLPRRHLTNGLAEMLKIALAHDRKFFDQLTELELPNISVGTIARACALKQKIVAADPFDNGVRRSLNFGHTIGHAIESVALSNGHDVLHGEALYAGMIIECLIAKEKKLMSENDLLQIETCLRRFSDPLPFKPAFEEMEPFLLNDKKMKGRQLLFALVTKPGKCRTDVAVSIPEIKKALQSYNRSNYAADRKR